MAGLLGLTALMLWSPVCTLAVSQEGASLANNQQTLWKVNLTTLLMPHQSPVHALAVSHKSTLLTDNQHTKVSLTTPM